MRNVVKSKYFIEESDKRSILKKQHDIET